MTDRQRMHDGIMDWIRMSDRKPTVDDADESGTVWVYDKVFADVNSVHFYQADSPYYTHWMPMALEFSDWYTQAKAKSTIAALRERLGEGEQQ